MTDKDRLAKVFRGNYLAAEKYIERQNNKKQLLSFYEVPKRPDVLKSEVHIKHCMDKKYAVVMGLYQNKPYEIFVRDITDFPIVKRKFIGKTTRVRKNRYDFIADDDSLILRCLDDNKDKELIICCAFVSMLLRHNCNIKLINKTISQLWGNSHKLWEASIRRTLNKFVKSK